MKAMMRLAVRPTAGAALLLSGLLMAGCSSTPSGGATGNGQAMPAPAQGTSVIVIGSVTRRVIPWQDGLTLMQAFVASGYQAASNPAQLGIIRKKQMPIYVNYKKLYDGQDMLLEPGDQIVIQP
jgi:hypothetical protein